ncbi:hypothetical protein EAI_12454 [Harpegnathos saltator]|uniref:Uncharacterized protein n=1 Tax=Harpegnathos saltator TaxID=610380 RepID=E2BXU1_HARSA|nr:hypothetical protein EAI_12454 [Harpegnathos saltator]
MKKKQRKKWRKKKKKKKKKKKERERPSGVARLRGSARRGDPTTPARATRRASRSLRWWGRCRLAGTRRNGGVLVGRPGRERESGVAVCQSPQS